MSNANVVTLRPSRLEVFLATTLKNDMAPVLIVGEPGGGKTALVNYVVADVLQYHLCLSHPQVGDMTDAKGMPCVSPDQEFASWKLFGDLAEVFTVAKTGQKVVLFLDDFGQAAEDVQKAWMQYLLGGKLGEIQFPKNVQIVVATNDRTHRAGVTGILEPVKSRFNTIVHLQANLDDWCGWAYRKGHIPPKLIAFLRSAPHLFSAFQPTADLTNSPCPRQWEAVAKWMNLGMDEDLEHAAISGAVGQEAAAMARGFFKIYDSMPSLDGILLDPKGAPIPDTLDALYAVSIGLAHKATPANCGRVFAYAERLYQEAGQAAFATYLLQDAVRRDQTLLHTPEFVKVASGPLGQLISGSTN